MNSGTSNLLTKLTSSWPWLSRYPLWRTRELWERLSSASRPAHLIVVVANHFEPAWNDGGPEFSVEIQRRRTAAWCRQARQTGLAIPDHDGTPFRHTCFYPGEQYDHAIVSLLAELESEGFGAVEIHLHHGTEEPDTPGGLRRALSEFRDLLAEEHGCLALEPGDPRPRYAFVHGNLALANSMGGRDCGVDNEMEILAQTGCYADLTLPAFPEQAQGPVINALYECGRPLTERMPYRTGIRLRVGRAPQLPIMMTGPLVFDWSRRKRGLPVLRIDDGVLTAGYPLTQARLDRWRQARITVRNGPPWFFIKLYCHGFFKGDQEATLGEPVRRFWSEAIEEAERKRDLRIHFATAREAFNIARAAIDGQTGDPHHFRNYLLHPIRTHRPTHLPEAQLTVT